MPKEPEKLRVSVIDFLPMWEKYTIGEIDSKGKEICYGHTVLKNGEKWLVAYRYGDTVLRQPFTMFSVGIKDYTQVEVINEVTAAQDWLIIGYDSEPFIQQLIADGKKR